MPGSHQVQPSGTAMMLLTSGTAQRHGGVRRPGRERDLDEDDRDHQQQRQRCDGRDPAEQDADRTEREHEQRSLQQLDRGGHRGACRSR